MPCRVIRDPCGFGAIVCTRGPVPKRKPDPPPAPCDFCPHPHSVLCDGPAPEGSGRVTCDAKICRCCALHRGRNVDLCPRCAEKAKSKENPR